MVVAGIVLLVVTAGLLVWERLASRRLAAMARTGTVRCADLASMRDAAPGAFSLACEVSGAAEPGERGLLTSELSKTGCVWFAYTISRRFEKVSHSEGRSTRSVDSRTVAKGASSTPFRVRDDSGAVLVDPEGAEFDRSERVVNQFERYPPGGELTSRFSGIDFTAGPGDLSGMGFGRTLGYAFEEWVLRPGQRVYVLGEASDRGGQLLVGKPSKGPYLVSTRSEQELARSARTQRTVARAAAALAGVGGAALLLLGLLR
jgi:E3 Ubiquitin ligase